MPLRAWLLLCFLTPAAAEDFSFFEKKIRPLLVSQCYACHSGQTKIPQAGLRLDDRENAMRMIVPGDVAASQLLRVLRHEAKPAMPPSGKLPAETIAAFEQWVKDGAPWPKDVTGPKDAGAVMSKGQGSVAERANHWAWQPLRPGRSPLAIDALLRQAAAAKGVARNGPADPATLLRRLTLDLTGLPPTTQEMQAILANPSAAQFQKTVDRLLGTRAYAERWARHWLDVTYYADTMDPNALIPAKEAWRYRDYVIAAFQADKPINQFLVEQLAGDLLPARDDAQRSEFLSATGYLALGPWTLVQADKEQLRMDVVDAQVDAIGKGMLGLTLGCARCHDHKFDPVSQREYFGMAGILASTRTLHGRWREAGVFSDINKEALPETDTEKQHRLERAAVYEREIADIVARIEKLELEKQTGDKKELDRQIQILRRKQGLLVFNRPEPPVTYAVRDEDAPGDCRMHIRGNAHQLSDSTPRTFVRAAMFGEPMPKLAGSGRLEMARWIVDPRNPLTARVYVNRVWQNLFGAGIVKSADNFGLRGERPTHPELLDQLAATFVAEGWSTKKLIARIVASETYRLSSQATAASMQVDPENVTLWRMSPRRLEAETFRDSVLQATGKLQSFSGGPTLPTQSLQTFAPDLGKVNPPRMVVSGKLPGSLATLRTIYQPVFRAAQMDDLDVLNLFDFANNAQINATRKPTVVPTQALYLMNAEWLRERARTMAAEALADTELVDAERVESLLARIYVRPVRAEEVKAGLDFIYEVERLDKSKSALIEAWAVYIHSLLASNEFLFRS